MIVIDTSALYAILTNEPEAVEFLRAISSDNAPEISAVTLYEAMIVCYARGHDPLLDDLRQLIAAGNIETIPFGRQAAETAHAAYRQFGKGHHHAAKLNLSYQLRLNSSAPVIPEAARGYPGSQQAPAFATIPDIASGISGMTPGEAINRIRYQTALPTALRLRSAVRCSTKGTTLRRPASRQPFRLCGDRHRRRRPILETC